MTDTLKKQVCRAWRTPGGFWSLSEHGKGETMGLRHTIRESDELSNLTDNDLREIMNLILNALESREGNSK